MSPFTFFPVGRRPSSPEHDHDAPPPPETSGETLGDTFGAIDRALGDLLARHSAGDGATRRILALTGALLGRQRGRGHSCIELDTWAGRTLPGLAPSPTLSAPAAEPADEYGPELPERDIWSRALAASGLVSDTAAADDDGAPTRPLVSSSGRLYLRRYFDAERRLARRVDGLLGQGMESTLAPSTIELFARLFPTPEERAIDWQAAAAAVALRSPLTLISGGPGTGKTTTVCRILALLLDQHPDLDIALAAPTGKAAARLAEAIGAQLESLPIDPATRKRLPRQATTLHRLLGYRPHDESFRYRADHPLECDLLLIDEASMVDLLLMDSVLDALPPSARLILLGDRDQLTSVETGFVFGDLCQVGGAAGHGRALRNFWRRLAGRPWPGGTAKGKPSTSPPPLLDTTVELRISFRFRKQPGIGALARALREGDGEAAVAVLAAPNMGEVRLVPLAEGRDPLGAVLTPIAEGLNDVLTSDSAAEALDRLGRFRCLTPYRRGPWGVIALNRRIEHFLAEQAPAVPGRPTPGEGWLAESADAPHWYRGRPLMITRNDPQLGLYNGDLGICWTAEGTDDRLEAYFPAPEGGIRRFPLAKLPPHETAWSMTVHKSQGSEFDQIVLVLGGHDTPLLGRELLYTAVTRARRSVFLVGEADLVRRATHRRAERSSGLSQALGLALAPLPSEVASTRQDERTDDDPGPTQLGLFDR